MKLIIQDDFESVSKQAATELFEILRNIEKPLICTASGASPAGMYRELVNLVQHSATDVSDWYFIGLDEWSGMNGADAGSSRHQLNAQLFEPLLIPQDHIFFFDGKADAETECRNAENFIAQQRGIDVAVLGIGVNGHIAMNEPGTPVHMRSHLAAILPETQAIGQKYFSEPRSLATGITLGLATLSESKQIMLLASGTSKAESLHRMLYAPVSSECPATFFRDHKGLHIYADSKAAALLPA